MSGLFHIPGVKVVGITGGIGSGKSTVAKILGEKGFLCIDADQIAKSLRTKDPETQEAIQKEFGTTDRKELRRLVYESAEARSKLEAILHPRIRQATQREIEGAIKSSGKKPPKLIFYEAALLVETGSYRDLDGLVVVTAPEEMRIDRVTSRDAIDRTAAEKIIQAQFDEARRTEVADHVVSNDGSLEDLEEEIKELIAKLTQ